MPKSYSILTQELTSALRQVENARDVERQRLEQLRAVRRDLLAADLALATVVSELNEYIDQITRARIAPQEGDANPAVLPERAIRMPAEEAEPETHLASGGGGTGGHPPWPEAQ